MPRNGSGVYSLVTTPFATAGAIAVASTVNANINDLGTEITGSLPRNGTAGMTANLAMGSNKITGLAAGTAADDAARVAQVQSGVAAQATAVGGTADAITLTFSPVFTAYAANMRIRWTSGGPNTVTNPTANADSLGARTIKKGAGAALVAGDTGAAGYICEAVYNGTDLILLNPASSVSLASTTEVLTGADAAKAVTADALAALWEKGANEASAGTVSFGEGGYFHITGTTAITDLDFDTAKDGRAVWVVFDGILTLTHNGTTLLLPGGANITTAANDRALFVQDNADNIICLSYVRADGTAVVGSGSAATQAEMEAAASTTVFSTPGRQHFHPSAAKFWLKATANSTTIEVSHNVTSVADTATGRMTVTIETDFSTADGAILVTGEFGQGTTIRATSFVSPAAGSFIMEAGADGGSSPAYADPTSWHACGFGDHA